MNQEERNTDLVELIEATAEAILQTCQPGATDDPLTAVKQLLESFLETALLYQEPESKSGEDAGPETNTR